MALFSDNIEKFFASEIFARILRNDTFKITELNVIMQLLIKSEIPFDISYSPGTRRQAAAIEFSIYINPTTNIDFIITLDRGGSTFFGDF